MLDILSIVEEIMVKYDLEKDIIENDATLKNKLSGIKNYSERIFIKYLYSEKINNFIQKNLTPDIPSVKLREIVEELIDKKISFGDLPNIIEKRLKISPDISKKISVDLEGNKEIATEMARVKEFDNDDEKKEPEKKEKNTKSIGYELLK